MMKMIDDILIGISLILTFFAFVNNKKREYINSVNFCLNKIMIFIINIQLVVARQWSISG